MHLYKSEEEGYIVFFEDDMEVSSQWYAFFQLVQKSGIFDNNKNITSLCLHPVDMRERVQCAQRKIANESLVLSATQFVCSWGPIWKRSHWKRLKQYSHNLIRRNILPYVPETVESGTAINSYIHCGFNVHSAYIKRFIVENNFLTMTYSLTTCFHEDNNVNKTFFVINHKEVGEHYPRKNNHRTQSHFFVDAEEMKKVAGLLSIANESQDNTTYTNATKIDLPHIYKPKTFKKSDFQINTKLCLFQNSKHLTHRKPIKGSWFPPNDFRSSLSSMRSFVSVPCTANVKDRNCTYISNDAYSVARYLNRYDGFYLEVGGFDGLSNSQTRYVESLGWSGVVIEADPYNYAKLVDNRPFAMVVNAIVCNDDKTNFHFVRNEEFSHLSGIWEHLTKKFREHWYSNITENNGDVIKCTPLSDILQSLCIQHVDYFRINGEFHVKCKLKNFWVAKFHSLILCILIISQTLPCYVNIPISVCGSELSVLQSVVWSKVTANVISVEVVRANEIDYNLLERVRNFLKDRKFLYEGILKKDAMFIHKRMQKVFK